MYGAGRVLIGFATGLLLVAALPPVIQHFPPDRMPMTAVAIDIGFFGAVTAGPLLGGAVALGGVWRWFYGGLAGIGVCVIITALFTLPDPKPFNPDLPFDKSAILLAAAATALPFWATGELLPRPDLNDWLENAGPALQSPALGAAIRRNKKKPDEDQGSRM